MVKSVPGAVVMAKFFVKSVTHHYTDDPDSVYGEVTLVPCYGNYPGGDSEENKTFAKWTPSGELKMAITNPDALAQYTLNRVFYIPFIPADE